MNVHTLLFQDSSPQYVRMASALAQSIRANSPSTPLLIHRPPEDFDYPHLPRGQQSNTRKTKCLAELMSMANRGELMCFVDADTFVLRDLSPIEEQDFDLAITYRPQPSRLPFNTGVIFARAVPRVVRFFREWFEANRQLVRDGALRQRMVQKFGGINQAALGMTLPAYPNASDLDVLKLDCAEWNCCEEAWKHFHPERTRIVHLVTKLRACCVGHGREYNTQIASMAKLWQRYDVYGRNLR